MSLLSQYPNGFSNGVTIRGLPISIAYPGKLLWVNNSNNVQGQGVKGSDSTGNGSYTQPLGTLMGAVSRANDGDIIMLGMGHAETINSSTLWDINKSVLVYGTGSGSLTPTLTYTTSTTSTLRVSADGVAICNVRLVANIAAVTSAVTLTTAKDFNLTNVLAMDTSGVLNFVNIVDTGTTVNSCDGLTIENSMRVGLGASTNTTLVKLDCTADRVNISNNYIAHSATTAGGLMIIGASATATNLLVANNICNLVGAVGVTDGILITVSSALNTGVLKNNLVHSLDVTSPRLVTALKGLQYFNNYYAGNPDASGELVPAVDTIPV